MSYCDISKTFEEYGSNRAHILNIIDWLYKECVSAGGDGDSFWYSRFYDVKDIYPLVEEFNKQLKHNMFVLSLDGDTINWYDGQQGIIITNNGEKFKSCPNWVQAILRY